jgi:cation transport regulator ChaC
MSVAESDAALFVYGSLLDAAHRAEVLGREVDGAPARIVGYERRLRRHYFLLARAGAETEGLLLSGLSAHDFAILDRYEEVPQLYTRERITVVGSDGAAIRCWVYLPTGALLDAD